MQSTSQEELRNRRAPLEMAPDEFRHLGHQLVDQIAEFLQSLPNRPVTPGESPSVIRAALGNDALPQKGTPAATLLKETADFLFDHSLFNGHPKFFGYITSSAAPIGALADLLAATVNPNVGGWDIGPAASEIEAQTIRWIAEFLGYPSDCGGLLVSGGNMANFGGFLAARKAKADWDIRTEGLCASQRQLLVYASEATHTWIQKAADLFGLGTSAIRWIPVDAEQQMEVAALERQIRTDQEAGHQPFMVVGAAGSVSVGAVDPLPEIAALCRQHDLWFHIDGAYGAPAAGLPEASPRLKALREADSIAVDPHKWFYSPLEAGCTLVRRPEHLVDAFSFHPDYYHFAADPAEAPINFYEYGMQNSRGFRALKIWLALRSVGRDGYVRMIRDDIALAEALYHLADEHRELQAFTHSLSITTFRYVPEDLAPGNEVVEAYLNQLNQELLSQLQTGGEAFVSNAVLNGTYILRACVVNFRTTLTDIEALPGIVTRAGREVDASLRPADLR